MLIDDFMPKFDFSEKHEINVRAGAERVYKALNEVDLCDSSIIRWLFRLRGLPSNNVTLRHMRTFRFEVLAETENRELLMGLAGKFWTPAGGLQKVNAGNFREFDQEGFAKATWDFSLEGDCDETKLSTETRIECIGDTALSRFGFYWTFIQPFSGWIRMEMLKLVKKKAEDNIER